MADARQILPPEREDSIENWVIVIEEGILLSQSTLVFRVPSEAYIEAEIAALLLTEALMRCHVFRLEIEEELIIKVVPRESDT